MTTDLAKSDRRIYPGIASSPGIAFGRLYFIDRSRIAVEEYRVDEHEVPHETTRLRSAIDTARTELAGLRTRLEGTVDPEHLLLIDTHLMIMSDDRLFLDSAHIISCDTINAEGALRRALHKYHGIFAAMDNRYLRERGADLECVIENILHAMAGKQPEPLPVETGRVIIVARDLTPGDLLQMDRTNVQGIVTEVGGRVSHTSILARALELPTVVGVEGVLDAAGDGFPAILDGNEGLLIVRPDEALFREYLQRKHEDEYLEWKRLQTATLLPVTLDGYRLELKGNVEIPEEGDGVVRHGGEGIGLYRTEMLFFNRDTMPDEEEQFQVYATMLRAIAPLPLTIRTMDAGGDKLLSSVKHAPESNPALGLRAIRFSLSMPGEFKKQLRAILRVSAFGDVRIMFPMISGLEELRRVRSYLDEAMYELEQEDQEFDKQIKVGVMIEVPSAVVIADLLAREVDFFSVGTNDLIQYSLAMDRTNEQLAALYQPLHPAVLRSLQRIVETAHEAGITAGICGEMAGDPMLLPLLLGLGYDELSMNGAAIPAVKQMLRHGNRSDAVRIVQECLRRETASEIAAYLREQTCHCFSGGLD